MRATTKNASKGTLMMRKKVVLAVCLIVVTAILVISINRNNLILSWMTERMVLSIHKDDAMELLDVKSVYGKLNGNGIQYFAAALVRATSEDDVKEFIKEIDKTYEITGYSMQTDSQIHSKYLQHKTLNFQYSDFNDEGVYYQVFFYCSHHRFSDFSSIVGH